MWNQSKNVTVFQTQSNNAFMRHVELTMFLWDMQKSNNANIRQARAVWNVSISHVKPVQQRQYQTWNQPSKVIIEETSFTPSRCQLLWTHTVNATILLFLFLSFENKRSLQHWFFYKNKLYSLKDYIIQHKVLESYIKINKYKTSSFIKISMTCQQMSEKFRSHKATL